MPLQLLASGTSIIQGFVVVQERDDSEQLVRELMRKTKKLQEDQAAAEQSLKVPGKQNNTSCRARHQHAVLCSPLLTPCSGFCGFLLASLTCFIANRGKLGKQLSTCFEKRVVVRYHSHHSVCWSVQTSAGEVQQAQLKLQQAQAATEAGERPTNVIPSKSFRYHVMSAMIIHVCSHCQKKHWCLLHRAQY